MAITGNDATGDGTLAHPWRSIQGSLDRIDYSHGAPTLYVGDGTYDERVLIQQSVTLFGSGSKKVTVKTSPSGDTGFVITADGTTAASPIAVKIGGLRIHGLAGKNRGMKATRAVLALSDIEVYQNGAYGIVIGPDIVGFDIADTTVGFQGMLYSDLGIDVQSRSRGVIRNFTGGDHIDHIINIGLDCNVTIQDSHLTGSPVWYADGIRVQGGSTVNVSNTVIVRAPGGQPAQSGATHNPPYAGIEIASVTNGGHLVTIDGCTVSGFDVGIGINMWYNRVLVQNTTLIGNATTDVRTVWTGSMSNMYPVVDFGHGPLGSSGNNFFGSSPAWAIQLGGPYGVTARGATWGPPGTDPDLRCYDHLDLPSLGSVFH